jgi:hypothetical protein
MFSLHCAIDYIEFSYGKTIASIRYGDSSGRKFIVEFTDNIGKQVFVKL